MEATYPDDGGREARPDAVPGLRPETTAASLTLEVDGETFAVRANDHGGTDYEWLSGPNPGYGFGVSPASGLSLDQHAENIRGFLSMVDPATGYIEDE